MRRSTWYACFFLFVFSGCARMNTLTSSERSDGWQLLFDGHSTDGWRGAYATAFPQHGWEVKKGVLMGKLSEGKESGDAGDIVTLKKYKDFDLVFEWKIGSGGNSGVKYFIEERMPKPQGSQAGYEYQLIDDANYIYNGKNLDQALKTGSLYDMVAARKPDTEVNRWHRSHIVVQGNNIQHWLDGEKVMEADRGTDAFRKAVEKSKFRDYPGFAAITEGHILLQDHGHSVAFKNIKIKEL